MVAVLSMTIYDEHCTCVIKNAVIKRNCANKFSIKRHHDF